MISERSRRGLQRIARAVPGPVHSFGFECRLNAGDDRVDLGIAVTHAIDERRRLERAQLPDDERWLRIGRFAREWSRVGSPLHEWGRFVFLEFDADCVGDPSPVPSVFVGLDSPIDGSSATSPELEAAKLTWSLLHERERPGDAGFRLEQAFATLPVGARVLHVAVMLGRTDPSLRLSVLLPGSQVARYLELLGATAAAGISRAVTADHGDLLEESQLDFDLRDGVHPAIGFGLRPGRGSSWPQLLDRLAGATTLSSDKCEALLHWPGMSSMSRADRCGTWLLRREISHVKLACGPGESRRLKAYLGVAPLRVTAAARERRE